MDTEQTIDKTKLVEGSFVYLPSDGADGHNDADEMDVNDLQSKQKAAFQNSFSLAASRK